MRGSSFLSFGHPPAIPVPTDSLLYLGGEVSAADSEAV